MKKIKEILKALGEWFSDTRWVWMLVGLVVGLSSCNFYNAAHSGVIAAIMYVLYYRCEYKKDHSWLTMVLVLLCSVAGQGLIQLLTEQ